MSVDPKDETEAAVLARPLTTRMLYACGLAWRMTSIKVRQEYQRILLTRNGFSDAEATVACEMAKARWDKLTGSEQTAARDRVLSRQAIKDLNVRRK